MPPPNSEARAAAPTQLKTGTTDPDTAKGIAYALSAFLLWGFAPAFFKLVSELAALDILANRVIWSTLFCAVLMTVARTWRSTWRALTRRVLVTLVVSTALLSCNWLIFIWAILQDQVLQVSLGYFINPLVSVLLGVVALKERLSPWHGLAVALAAAGVLVMSLGQGGVPLLALGLAVSFGIYGYVRKIASIEALGGLFVETLLVVPFAIGYLSWLGLSGRGGFGGPTVELDIYLALTGVMTALPLLLFTAGARRLKLSSIGLLQYLAPSLHFVLAVLFFGEPLTPHTVAAFALIWVGLGVYSYGVMRGRGAGGG